MEQEKIDLIIDKKIADAKLEVVEKRFQITIWSVGILLALLAALFGMIIPMVTASRNTDKVDEQIRWMQKEVDSMKEKFDTKKAEYENRFETTVKEISTNQETTLGRISNNADKMVKDTKEKVQELIGQQLRKPIMTCLYSEEEISGKTIRVEDHYYDEDAQSGGGNINLLIFNRGDAPAKNIEILIHFKDNSSTGLQMYWSEIPTKGEKDYKYSYKYDKPINKIDAKLSEPLSVGLFFKDRKATTLDVLLEIFYEQPDPVKIFFKIEKPAYIKK